MVKFEEVMRNRLKIIPIEQIEDCLSGAITKLLEEDHKVKVTEVEFNDNPFRESKISIKVFRITRNPFTNY